MPSRAGNMDGPLVHSLEDLFLELDLVGRRLERGRCDARTLPSDGKKVGVEWLCEAASSSTGIPSLRRHVAPEILRNDAAQIQRHDRKPGITRRQDKRSGEQRIVRAIRRPALAIGIAVHRPEGRRSDVDLGQTRFEFSSARAVTLRATPQIVMRFTVAQALRRFLCMQVTVSAAEIRGQCDNISNPMPSTHRASRRLHLQTFCRQSGGGVRAAVGARGRVDAECRPRDEPIGNRIPGARKRRLPPPLVHAGGRSGSLRSRDARQRARAVGRRSS